MVIMRIDVHTHVFHDKIATRATSQLVDHYSHSLSGDGTAKCLTDMLDRAGIERAFVHSAATKADQVIPANTWALKLKENKRFIPFGTVHPDFSEWEKELERLEKNGIRGIKFHPDFQGFSLDDRRMFPIYEAIQGRFAVMFHVGDTLPPEKNPSSPQKLSRVLENFPSLTAIAAHFGGYCHWEWVCEYLSGKRLFMDTSSSLKFIPDILLKKILSSFPEETFLFGSDYPLGDPNEEIEMLKKKAGFSEGRLERLLERGNTVFDCIRG